MKNPESVVNVVEQIKSPFEASLSVALGDVQPNGLRRAKPLVTGVAVQAVERLRNVKCAGNVFDGKAIDIESIVVENWFGHDCPISITSTVALSTSTTALRARTDKAAGS